MLVESSTSDPACNMQDLCCEERMGSLVVTAQLPYSMWDPSLLTRDRILVPCIAGWILNLWITGEVYSFRNTILIIVLLCK